MPSPPEDLTGPVSNRPEIKALAVCEPRPSVDSVSSPWVNMSNCRQPLSSPGPDLVGGDTRYPTNQHPRTRPTARHSRDTTPSDSLPLSPTDRDRTTRTPAPNNLTPRAPQVHQASRLWVMPQRTASNR